MIYILGAACSGFGGLDQGVAVQHGRGEVTVGRLEYRRALRAWAT